MTDVSRMVEKQKSSLTPTKKINSTAVYEWRSLEVLKGPLTLTRTQQTIKEGTSTQKSQLETPLAEPCVMGGK